MIVLILSRHSSSCGFVAFPVRCKRCTSWAASSVSVSFNGRRQDVESSWFNLWHSFNHNPWQWGSRSFFVSYDFLRQLQFWSHHLPRSATQTFPVGRFPSIAQRLSCPAIASHNSSLGNAQNCSCSIMMTNKDSLSHATCKRTDTVLSNFSKPNFLSKLRHWLSPSSTSSSHFTRLSIFANSLILFMTCAAKRRSQLSNRLSSAIRTLVFLFSGNLESSTLSFHFSHSHFRTTVGHVITLGWSLRNHFQSYTCVNHRILECFRARGTIAFQNDSATTQDL